MRTLFCLLAVCCLADIALGVTEEEINTLLQHKDACIASSGVDPAAIEKAKRGDIDVGDEKLACFAGCILQKLGIIDDNLNTHKDVAISYIPASIPRARAEEIIDKCSKMSGNQICVKGGNTLKCILENKDLLLDS